MPRPLTSNNNEQIDIPPKHEDKLESKNDWWTMGLTEKGISVGNMTWAWKMVSGYTRGALRWKVVECWDHSWSGRGERHSKVNREKPQTVYDMVTFLRNVVFFKARISSLRCIENETKRKKRYSVLSKKGDVLISWSASKHDSSEILWFLKDVHEDAKFVTYLQLRFTVQKNGVRTRSSGKHAYEKHKL